MVTKLAEYALLCIGAFFLFLSCLGLWRLDDFYQRIHAPTKAITLGLASLFAASVIAFRDGVVAAKAILAVVFIGATAPVGAHFLASTGYRCGLRPRRPIVRDEYASSAGSEGPPAGPSAGPSGRGTDQPSERL